jgi:hypothetical protein
MSTYSPYACESNITTLLRPRKVKLIGGVPGFLHNLLIIKAKCLIRMMAGGSVALNQSLLSFKYFSVLFLLLICIVVFAHRAHAILCQREIPRRR